MATKSAPGPDGPRLETTRKGVDYLLRPYEEGDAAGVVSLLSSAESDLVDETWFRHTYAENPYVDHVPLFVAEADGEVVGVRPFSAFRVRAGEETELALLTRDTVVHEDHRRRGLFTSMTELALEHYAAGEPAFFFSHSNSNSLPGYEKMGWSPAGHRETYSRVHDADALVERNTRDSVGTVLSPVAAVLSRAHLAVRDRTGTSPEGVAVTRHDAVPEDLMASLYARRRPETPHVVRDEAFYRWRFGNPEWEPNAAYVARRDGEALAGAVTCEEERQLTTASVVDVVPRTGGEDWESAVAAILARVVSDYRESDLIRVPEPVFPTRTLEERGFLSSDHLPLSALVDDDNRLTLGIRPLTDDATTIDGHPVREATAELWSLAH